jgi:phosphatidate phosphatase APP1
VSKKLPILLSFYGLSNTQVTLAFGQLTYTPIKDLTFIDYGPRKTFRTLFRLYHTKPYSSQELTLVFDKGEIKAKTNSNGGFYEKVPVDLGDATLKKVVLSTGQEVKIVDGLYHANVHKIDSSTIVISDIDDTLLHSFIYRKIKKFSTLMFTRMEKRKVVTHMQDLMRNFTDAGAAPVYLSNSEQNLYPMIFRFLFHNKFPRGPLFLKQLRSLWDVVTNVKFPLKNTHKINTIEDLMKMFPEKKFILMGDNTQHDLQIYLSVAEKFATNIRYIIIRKVVDRKADEDLIKTAKEKLKGYNIVIHYSETFPQPILI